ncbi:MAG TPA: hypothetical protein PLW55_14430, partial [Leptospiraceae bacterium]|nr:hypothetical protein [Leptospiraceae bacterium]
LATAIQSFQDALLDDLNISRALAAVFDAVSDLNSRGMDADLARQAVVFFYAANQIIAVLDFRPEDQREKPQADLGDLASYVQSKIEERLRARAEKNWALSDQIRDELKAKGIILKDSPQGTTWEKA